MELKHDPASSFGLVQQQQVSGSDSLPVGRILVPISGPGTKLYVTDQEPVRPEVSVCPLKTRTDGDRTSLMCLASDMFPPVVQFSWKRQQKNGPLQELTLSEGEKLEVKGQKKLAIIIRQIDEESLRSHKYICSAKHESGTEQGETEELPAATSPAPKVPAAPTAAPASPSLPDVPSTFFPPDPRLMQTFQTQCRVKLLGLLYSVLIVKSLVFCCGLSLLRSFTNQKLSIN